MGGTFTFGGYGRVARVAIAMVAMGGWGVAFYPGRDRGVLRVLGLAEP